MPSKIINACKSNVTLLIHKSIERADINKPDMWGRFPIYYAVRYGSVLAIEHYMSLGASIYCQNTISNQNDDLMVTAIKMRDIAVFKVILSYWKTSIDIVDYMSVLSGSTVDIFDLFLLHTSCVSIKGLEYILCKNAKPPHYKYLYSHDICFDVQQALKYTLIYRKFSCFSYLLSTVRHTEQLNYIYNTSLGERKTFTLMSLCSIYGYLNGIRRLLYFGADPNLIVINYKGEAMNNLMVLVSNELYNRESHSRQVHIQNTLKYLLKLHYVNWSNSRGQTAIMFAYRAHPPTSKIISILKNAGADLDCADMLGKTALDYSSSKSISSSASSSSP